MTLGLRALKGTSSFSVRITSYPEIDGVWV